MGSGLRLVSVSCVRYIHSLRAESSQFMQGFMTIMVTVKDRNLIEYPKRISLTVV